MLTQKYSRMRILVMWSSITVMTAVGAVLGNLHQRRADVRGIESRANLQRISAHVPLAEVFGYATDLRSLSQGRATYTMEFSHYAVVPETLATQILGVDIHHH